MDALTGLHFRNDTESLEAPIAPASASVPVAPDCDKDRLSTDWAPAMPCESPLAMPIQSLYHFDRLKDRGRRPPSSGFWSWLSRLIVFGGAFALTAYGAYQ